MKRKEKGSIDLRLLRNIGIAAHIDAGKTTTTERILYYTGKVHRLGEVDEGTATMDWMEQEQERGITITSAVTFCGWQDHYLNIIDTPGHVDFTVEVERSLRVLDGAVVIFCGVGGVEPQSETVWRQCDRYAVSRIAYINKLDRRGAAFFEVVQEMKDKLGANPVPIQIPFIEGEELLGIIDLIQQKMIIYKDAGGADYEYVAIPEKMQKDVLEWRHYLIEKVSEIDDHLMEKYVNEEVIEKEEIKGVLRKGTIQNKLVPVICGSSLKNRGVQPLLDAVVDYLPSPLDLEKLSLTDLKTGEPKEIDRSADAPLSILLFKIQTDPYVGKLSFVRVYSGLLRSGSYVYNATTGKRERAARILRMHANKRAEVSCLEAGDVGGIVGLKRSKTGDTLCEEKNPFLLESIQFPQPVIAQAIEPKTKADQEKLGEALKKLSDEDPTFQTIVDPETGQTIISGMGELHLEILVDRLKREFRVAVGTGRPQVAFRETVRKEAVAEGRYVKQTGGRGQFGVVKIKLLPRDRGAGSLFTNKIVGGAIPREFISAIEKGIEEAANAGVLAGYPVIDTEVVLVDGQYHEVDSSEIAYKIAASLAFKKAAERAKVVLLEPLGKVEITTPEEFVGDIISDINSRRGKIESIELLRGNTRLIRALSPMSEMFGYATDLRSLSQGRAAYAMHFSHYTAVPEDRVEKLLGKRRKVEA